MNQQHRSLRHLVPSLNGLLLFEASARHLNFSKAAEELAISQPAVSHGIRQLEEALGYPLFLRENRTLTLTSHGQKLFASVAKSFGSLAESLDDISASGKKDTVVVGTSTVLAIEWLLPRLPDLRQHWPDLKLEIRSYDRDPDLMSQGIDVLFRLGDGNWPGYEATSLWAEKIMVVCSPDYLRAHGPIIATADVLKHTLIVYTDLHRQRAGWPEWIRAQNIAGREKLRSLLHVNDSLVALKAAEAGEGLALGWCPIVDEAIKQGRLIQAVPEVLETGRHHYILTASATPQRRVVKQFCTWLVGQCAPNTHQA